MATVILARHGRTTANASGMLAGRQAGVRLDEAGAKQAAAAGARLEQVPLVAIVTSPLTRCRQTAAAIAEAQRGTERPVPRVVSERGLVECDYGDWQGRAIKDLAKEDLWKVVQAQPSAVTFPGGESMQVMQARAVEAIRGHDAAIEAEHGPGAVWVAVSHGDIIKSILADALGTHLDQFQRIHVDPASLSVVRYTSTRPYVLGLNTHAGALDWLVPPAGHAAAAAPSGDAVVGGGAGPSATASEAGS
ncbi:MSMEG_4193 family putative phosphomutase [Nocardioides pacificus]